MYQHKEFDGYSAYQDVSEIYHKFLEDESIEELGEYSARESAYQETLQHVEAAYGKQSEQCAAAHYYLANFYQGNSDIIEAVAHWEKVLAIEETLFGALSEDYCNTLNNLGMALADNYELSLGESFLRLSLAISGHKNYNEKGHTEFQLARSLEESNRTGRLVGLFKKITEIATSSELKGMAYHSLAVLYDDISGDHRSAEHSYQLAIEHLRNSTNKDQLANTLLNYGYFLFDKDRLNEAEKCLHEALEVQLSFINEDPEEYSRDLTWIYKALTRLSLKKADDEQMLHWTGQWLELAQRYPDLDINDVLEKINNLLVGNGDIEKRYRVLKTIVSDFPSIPAKLQLAYCARDIGATEEAKTILMEIASEACNDHSLQGLFHILLDKGDFTEAEKLETELLNNPQLSLLLKTAMLEKKESLSDSDIKSLVQSLLKEFNGLSGENEDGSGDESRLMN